MTEGSAYQLGFDLGKFKAGAPDYDARWDLADAAREGSGYFAKFKRGFDAGFDEARKETA